MTESTQHRPPSSLFLLMGLTTFYTLGFFLWYSATPLGIQPVLDGKENLQIASAISMGALPSEPFYRAPFYPACLACFQLIGCPENWLPFMARLFNGLCHIASTFLVYHITKTLWKHHIAATAAGLLYGLNPVALHFAADPLDITLAITLLLLAVHFAIKSLDASSHFHHAIAAGIVLGIGCITRPHLLPVAIGLTFLFACIDIKKAVSLFGGTACILFLFGLVNLALSSQFKILPTQGAYNLWAANKPGAHGKYLSQSIFIHDQEEHVNPTRLEAQRLYQQETQSEAPLDENAVNRYWRSKTIKTILGDPLTWISQMALKTYYLINNYEQYNNKTYIVHKAISPWLRYNPINWTIMLSLGAAGLLLRIQQRPAQLIIIAAVFYAAGVLLFFVSARFRLPLVPLLAIGIGGAIAGLSALPTINRKKLIAGITAVTSIAAISLTSFANVKDPITTAEDFLLISHASSDLNRHNEAQHWAGQALLVNPQMQTARELLCISKYNLLLESLPELPSKETLAQDLAQCLQVSHFSDQAIFIGGLYSHLLGQSEQAQQLWRHLIEKHSNQTQSALAALQLTQSLQPQERQLLQTIPVEQKETMLLISESLQGNPVTQQHLASIRTPEEIDHHVKMIQALFPK